MLLLALDTSTRFASVALCSQEALLSEYTWFAGGNHSVDLLDHIQQILAEQKISLQEVDAIAVATGPGSFNSVRVALATAKALSFSLKKPLIGISTLEIIAGQQRYYQGPVCALLEAGRSELYAACYIFDDMRNAEETYHPRQLGNYLLSSPQHLSVFLQEQATIWFESSSKAQSSQVLLPFLFCGEISEASRQALSTALPGQSLFVSGLLSARHAATLALLALHRLHEGEEDDPLVLEPLYLRRPSITTSTRKRPLLGGTVQRPAGQSTTEREEGALRH
ncbi:MAG: tRNA (adenosine(37)-N6)-threonylcarbamoyltransferase complex dimerization subunit type 1 TsaB [Ktedonobacteraceae bacterium]|nr:tRNA (adenosine(37)-N6)-threonylcarbamoyltransferase complex dimerization subunit type 1 TsaB [Ktedonobacteraceae bacterium]